jgi:outer membrane immunogenic protein
MCRLSLSIIAAASTVAFVQAASAADLPRKAPPAPAPVAPYNWTGWYIGANAGGGWSSNDVSFIPNDPAATFVLTPGQPNVSLDPSGFIGGAQLGYNWQFNRSWVLGFETDFQGSGIKDSQTSVAPTNFGRPFAPVEEKINWFGTVRARLGYLPIDNLLVFVTGGFAYGEVERNSNYFYVPGFGKGSTQAGSSVACGITAPAIVGASCFVGAQKDPSVGWTLGGGLEYAFWQRWTVKAEYLYVSLDTDPLTAPAQFLFTPGNAPASINVFFKDRTNINVARLGLNYRF